MGYSGIGWPVVSGRKSSAGSATRYASAKIVADWPKPPNEAMSAPRDEWSDCGEIARRAEYEAGRGSAYDRRKQFWQVDAHPGELTEREETIHQGQPGQQVDGVRDKEGDRVVIKLPTNQTRINPRRPMRSAMNPITR
jgi:hypothetical protein